MKAHKLAKFFPMLEGADFDDLVEDIRQHGQLEPITMIGDEILDGVNRWKACQRLHIEPKTRQFKGDDPLSYVVSVNVRRRHLNQSQRAALAVEMLPLFEAEAKERMGRSGKPALPDGEKRQARDDAARAVGAAGRTVQQAKRVKEEDPKAYEEVKAGTKSLYEADHDVTMRKAKEARDKGIAKTIHREVPAIVKEFCGLISDFKELLVKAVVAKKKAAFSPETVRFVDNKMNQIEALIEEWRSVE